MFACDNSLTVQLTLNNQCYDWLVDTGATISAIKYKHCVEQNLMIHEQRTLIKGIGGVLETIGYVCLSLTVYDKVFDHVFYVFKTLPCKAYGILGHDFLNKYKANLDLNTNFITIRLHYQCVTVTVTKKYFQYRLDRNLYILLTLSKLMIS